jgi:hypothetical protein
MNDLNRMAQDIVTAAQLVEAPYSETVIRQTLAAFGGFARSSVQFRTTTKPATHRRLDVRYEEIRSPERPLEVARRAGYFADQGREVDRLLPQLYEHFPCLGDGADFDVLDGVTKLWFFPKGVIPVANIFKVSSLPSSVAHHAAYYDQYHLQNVYIVGVDFHSQSVNLYFRFDHPSHHTPEALRGMVKDLGYEAPPEEAITYSLPGISAALTYTWNSSAVERICFYVGHPNREATPTTLHPIIARFVNEVPALKDSLYQVSWTFGKRGTYIKVENDYTGDMMENIVPAIMAG